MRHRKTREKFSRNRGQRKAVLKSLVRSILVYERIETTPRKAKAAGSKAEQLITLAKRNNLHARRTAFSFLGDHKLVQRLFNDISPRFKDINGGYTRMIKSGLRCGDGADLAVLEFTKLKEVSKKGKASKKAKEPRPSGEKDVSAQPKGAEPSKAGLRQGLKKIFKKRRDT